MVVLVGVVLAGMFCVVALSRRFMVVTVAGPSMAPTLRDGDRVLVRRCAVDLVRRGDIVVLLGPRMPGLGVAPADFMAGATNEERTLLIKRAVAVPGDPLPGDSAVVSAAEIVVTGDNENMSYDSRQAGPFDARNVRGVVVRRLTMV
ncbi:S26 family signal peptidase [Kutzneria chonburiensis]|uniref:S26 family signal peptidase n=1 Tax=Kutzneria chonburiensis TaxID=1483604 RepID=A0ABV6MPN4_9PSEU|nr:S26 family signal peptidase [Kutzneria chonburiensis]